MISGHRWAHAHARARATPRRGASVRACARARVRACARASVHASGRTPPGRRALTACAGALARAGSPPKKPLGEILASDQDAHKLAASERAAEDLLSRLAECERRLKQHADFAALVKSRADDPAAARLGGQEQDRYRAAAVRLRVALRAARCRRPG
jgi:hypothetical protein